MTQLSLVDLPSGDCYWTLLMISQQWFMYWLGAMKQQAITRANVDPDPCRHMVPLGHNELNCGESASNNTLSSVTEHCTWK